MANGKIEPDDELLDIPEFLCQRQKPLPLVTPVTDEPVGKPNTTPHTEAVPTVAPISDADGLARSVDRWREEYDHKYKP